jgi:hypothetical protein
LYFFRCARRQTRAGERQVPTAHPIRVDNTGGLATVDLPVGWFHAVQGPLIFVTIGLLLAFIARQALSWRRSSGDRRQQLKWLASGAVVTIICLVLATSFGTSGDTSGGPKTLLGVISGLAWFGVVALPVSIGVGILLPPWWQPRCSIRSGGGCSTPWTAVQPGPLRRRAHGDGFRGASPGRRGPRRSPRRPHRRGPCRS